MKPGAPAALWVAACIVLAFMILPSVIVMGMSFSGGRFLEFPPSTVCAATIPVSVPVRPRVEYTL